MQALGQSALRRPFAKDLNSYSAAEKFSFPSPYLTSCHTSLLSHPSVSKPITGVQLTWQAEFDSVR